MSLFDVIKYPFSNPPTEAEIAALPQYLKDFIFSQCFMVGLSKSEKNAEMVLYIYSMQPANKFRTNVLVDTVRKSLLEM